MAEDKEFYTSAELAKEFYVEAVTVRQWVKRGLITPEPEKIKGGRGGRISVFSRQEIQRFSESRYGNE